MTRPSELKVKRLLASIASVAIAVFFFRTFEPRPRGGEWILTALVCGIPLLAGGVIWIRRVSFQMLARGLWWSVLLVGVLMALSNESVKHDGAFVVLAATLALLITGASGLSERDEHFRPLAFRGTLTLALVLAMADTASFLWLGVGSAIYREGSFIILLVPPMLAGIVGLLRLRTWGLVLSLACSLTVAVAALARLIELPGPFRALFITTALAQLLVPLPMLITIVRGRVPGEDRWSDFRRVGATTILVAIAGISVYGAFLHRGPLGL